MKCSHCGYEFREKEVVHFKVGQLESYEILEKIRQGRIWVPLLCKQFSVECPKCGEWMPPASES